MFKVNNIHTKKPSNIFTDKARQNYKYEMFDTDIIITNFTINNNIINTKSNMTYNTWTMININSTIFTDRTITKVTIRN